jgi:NOL1/NOP2/fmu family ribosome biogenesis protein
MGERIGRLENGEFAPNWILGKNRDLAKVAKCELADEATLHRYLSGFELSSDSGDGLVQIAYKNRFLGLERVRNGKITNSFPKEWRRK